MLIGQTIYIPYVPEGPATVFYGPWTARQGDALTVVCDVMREYATGWILNVVVETKNNEDADSSASALGSLAMSAVATDDVSVTGCLELFRYRYEVSAEAAAADLWIHFRMNPAIWQPN